MLKLYSFGRFGIVLLLLTLLLSSFGAASAKGPVEEETVEFDPHASVSSDGSSVEQDLSGVRYDRFGAYVPEAAGSAKQAHGPDRVADDEQLDLTPVLPAPDRVNGEDTRIRITNTTDAPYRRIVYFTSSIDAHNYSCTGWLISADTVATAGHCVYIGFTWVTNVRVYPGRDGATTPYGSCGAKRLYASAGWTNKRDINYDYGAIKLDCTVGEQTGFFGYRQISEDAQALVGQPANAAGYPIDKATATLWHDKGDITANTTSYANLIFYTTDMYNGQSGSPVYNSYSKCRNCAFAINTLNGSPSNIGTRITRPVFNNLTSWKNAR